MEYGNCGNIPHTLFCVLCAADFHWIEKVSRQSNSIMCIHIYKNLNRFNENLSEIKVILNVYS